MRLTFIAPGIGLVEGKPELDGGRMEPLAFAVLKALTPAEHQVRFHDDRFEALPFDEPTDAVAITTEIFTARRAYEIADRFRRRGVKVILGGCHASLVPEESLEHADAVVVGEAEPIWHGLLDDLRRGGLRRVYRGSRGGEGFRCRPVRPDRSLFGGKSYLPIRLTQFSRGCAHACDFCAVGALNQCRQGHRAVDDVVREIAKDGARLVFFVDDNIVADPVAAKELFRALVPLGIRWFSQGDLSFARDPALLDLMVESGCVGLVVGFESLDRGHLVRMGKRSNLHFESYDEPVEQMRAAGLQIWAAFLLGYDNETPESVERTCSWALSKKFAFSAFNILVPYPGTPFYVRMEREGRLLYGGRWWLHDDYRFGMPGHRPRRCSAEDLAQACQAARLRHSSPLNVFARALDRRTHLKDLFSLVAYLSSNPLFRAEVVRKHGMPLGYRGMERGRTSGETD